MAYGARLVLLLTETKIIRWAGNEYVKYFASSFLPTSHAMKHFKSATSSSITTWSPLIADVIACFTFKTPKATCVYITRFLVPISLLHCGQRPRPVAKMWLVLEIVSHTSPNWLKADWPLEHSIAWPLILVLPERMHHDVCITLLVTGTHKPLPQDEVVFSEEDPLCTTLRMR